jgi:hypothetical protein
MKATSIKGNVKKQPPKRKSQKATPKKEIDESNFHKRKCKKATSKKEIDESNLQKGNVQPPKVSGCL